MRSADPRNRTGFIISDLRPEIEPGKHSHKDAKDMKVIFDKYMKVMIDKGISLKVVHSTGAAGETGTGAAATAAAAVPSLQFMLLICRIPMKLA